MKKHLCLICELVETRSPDRLCTNCHVFNNKWIDFKIRNREKAMKWLVREFNKLKGVKQ